MRNIVLATAVATTLALAAPQAIAQAKGAASKAEVQAIEAQMKALAERLNRLESANSSLQSQNEELRAVVERRDAEIDYLKAQTRELREDGAVTANELGKVKGADWATRIKFKGDFRVRDENIEAQRLSGTGDTAKPGDSADRNRARYRARFGFDAKVTDNVKATIRLASGDGDPRSTNQTMTNIGSGKEIWIDQAFIDWKFMDGADLLLGKQPYAIWRPGWSLFFDGDLNQEGAAVKFEKGMFFGSAYWWWLQENSTTADPNLWGVQGGLKFSLFGGETRVAAHYYDCGACQYGSPYWDGTNSAYGNTTIPNGSTTLLRYDYNVLQLSGEMGLSLFSLPMSLWVDWAQNMASDVQYDTAYAVGAMLGKASAPGTWEAGLMWQEIDKDALFAQFIDSDFAGGLTDSSGWVFKAGYAPVKNITFNATYFLNEVNKDVPRPTSPPNNVTGLDYKRLQLDVNYKF